MTNAARSSDGEGMTRATGSVVAVVLFVALLPLLLNVAGIDFTVAASSDAAGISSTRLHESLRGSFVHLLLEWSAVAAAIFTSVLALAYRGARDRDVVRTIAMALLAAGTVDAFHALAATYLIRGVADAQNFIPFTWAVSRVFQSAILLVGSALILGRGRAYRSSRPLLPVSAALFGLVACGAIYWSATAPELPQTMYPEAMLTRPWDVIPLLLFGLGGLVVFPMLYLRHPSFFSLALWVSAFPAMVMQLYMAFSSASLYDNGFNVAHTLKIVTFLVPLVGLIADYVRSHESLRVANERLESARSELAKQAGDLKVINEELEQFAYAASHDLRSPLRGIDQLASWLQEDLEDRLDDDTRSQFDLLRGRVQRMDRLLSALLQYALVGRKETKAEEVAVADIVNDVAEMLDGPAGFEVRIVGDLPVLRTARSALQQVFLNLIGNAVKHHDGDRATVEVVGRPGDDGFWEFEVRDDGPGIPPQMRERAFELFQTLQPRDAVEGSGMGLALVRKHVVAGGGQISCEGRTPRGTTFRFTWPVDWEQRA